MFKTILVALCDKELSLPVTKQAIHIARREQARAIGLYVVDQEALIPPVGTEGITPDQWRAEVGEELEGFGQSLLDQFVRACEMADVSADIKLLAGPVAKIISRQAHTADLIVMGRGGEYTRRGGMLGCCYVEGVVRQARRPVLVAASMPRKINRMLVAFDGGAAAGAALAAAARISTQWRIPLLLAVVAEKKVDRNVLLEGQSYLESHGLQSKTMFLEGIPSDAILKAGEEENADLIVIGAYCHDRIQELVFGGTMGQVVNRAPCPVLICC